MTDITREEVERIMALAEKVPVKPADPIADSWFTADDLLLDHLHISTVDAAHIAACDPQTILALCAAALRGIEGEEEPVAWRYRLIEELRSEDSHWTYREYDPKHESFEVEALYARSQR